MYDPSPTHAPTVPPSIASSMAWSSMKNTNETTRGVNNSTEDGESKYDNVGAPDDFGYSKKDGNEISNSNTTMIDTGDGDNNAENNTAIEEIYRLDDRDDESNLTGSHRHRNLWSLFVDFLYNRKLLDEMPNNSTDEVTPETAPIDVGDDNHDDIAGLSLTSGDSLMNTTEKDDAEGDVVDNQAAAGKPIEEPVEEDPADAAIEAGEPE
jgi:hypothetical protein